MNRHDTDPADVESIDAIMRALYETISFAPGNEPDWERLRGLFLTDGSFIPPRDPSEDSTQVLGVEAFIHRAKRRIQGTEALQEKGFYEVEVSRRIDQFSNIAQVLSVYEGRFGSKEDDFAVRGVNSVQLLFENDRWWVVGIMWADETEDNEIPESLLGGI